MSGVQKLFSRLLYSVFLPTGIIVVSFYIFNSLGDMTFLTASVLAFAIGAYSIHLIFKYWVSTEQEDDDPQQQMMRFMIVFIVNAAINAEIVYLMVTYLEIDLLIAQTVAAVIIAYESYYAYRSLVFRAARRRTVGQELSQGKAAPEHRDRMLSS
jgi:putative flippase GtrA